MNICSTQSFRDPGSLHPWVFHPLGSQSSPLNVWGKKHEKSHRKSTRGWAGKGCPSLLSIFHEPDLSHGPISLLGEAHWLKLPTLARCHSNHLYGLFYDRVLVRNSELISHHQLEEFRKGQKEIPRFRPPPRILLTGIHLGWAMHASPGRILSQNDWPKTAQKLIPSP